MRAGGDKRGNNRDRKNRKNWLLSQYGDGKTCNCVHCGKPLDFSTVEADRIIPGGSYSHGNIQPADRHCNASRSNNLEWRFDASRNAQKQLTPEQRAFYTV